MTWRKLVLASLLLANVSRLTAQQRPALNSSSAALSREHWKANGRLAPGAADLRRQALQHKLQARTKRLAVSSPFAVQPGWASLGPSPLPSDASGTGIQDYGWVTGRVTSIAIDPNDPTGNTVFVGAANGGVWKSTNAGDFSTSPASVVWTPLTDDQLTLAIGAMAVQPQNSSPDPDRSIVLAGTGETNSSFDSYYGLGILRSGDGGSSWTLISQNASGTHNFSGVGFSKIAFSSVNPNLVVAAAASASQGIIQGLEIPANLNRGIYYSTDAGLTWHAASISENGISITGASVTSVAFNAAAGRFFAAVRYHGFYVSLDGANWTRLAVQPGVGLTPVACPAVAAPLGCPFYRGEIAIVPDRSGASGVGEMYVWYVDSNEADQGIWVSTTAGASWLQIDSSGITNCGDFFGGCGTEQGTYSLALAAVPNGSVTDLYAGAVNLYKCTVVLGSSTCNGSGPNRFVNLSHAYGCSDVAKVHPNQHAIDSHVRNGKASMYFANDGGVYRALDGFTGLTTGNCGLSNHFDNLNATLGPLTQFSSLGGAWRDENLIVGAAEGNGAPATAFLQSHGPWLNVNAGDVGAVAISPLNDAEWFISTPPGPISGVNVFRCGNGIDCHSQDFQSDPVVTGNLVGGDSGPFYLPFILDPANPGTMLVGTCRIWRGSSSGGSFSLLSPNFEVGGNGACSGTETNMVRAIAAGGPSDASGNSHVIYAATNGNGPTISSSRGGRLWVATDASAGASSWADRTGAINPQGFPISSIVVDPADPSGQTAYVAVMGFHNSHVWKTISAGLSWIDFTGNLPDAPADSLVIDSATAMIYAGTDVGVFASGTADPIWTELGPASGQPGFLPNVEITSLQLFNSGGNKRLRAGSYGRGVWEWNLVTTPDFQIEITDSQQTILAGQSATFTGGVYARNGYTNEVAITCTADATAAPQVCSATPALLMPAPQGTSFSIAARDVPGDYYFKLQAAGTDAASVTHSTPLVLRVVDFNLGKPSPESVTLAPGTNGSPVTLSVSTVGLFAGTVSLSCGPLPAELSCHFQPSAVSPTVGNPVAAVLVVSASTSAALGTSQITISAISPGGIVKMQILPITVAPIPDYAVSVPTQTLTASVNTPAIFDGTISAVNSYNSSVTLTCGAGAPPNCSISPADVVPTPAGVPFRVSVSSSVAQAYSFPLNALGTDSAATAHSVVLSFTAQPNQTFDFTMSATPRSVAIAHGRTATFSVAVNPNTGAFPNNLTVSCSGLPALASCNFNPPQISSGSGQSTVTVSMSTTAPSAKLGSLALAYPIACVLILPVFRIGRRRLPALSLGCLLMVAGTSCGGGLQGGDGGGGGGNPGTKPGDYIVTLSATCGAVVHSTNVTLTVTQ